jgi:hypothetical protein
MLQALIFMHEDVNKTLSTSPQFFPPPPTFSPKSGPEGTHNTDLENV